MDEYRAAQQRLAAQLVQQETSTATPPPAGASVHDEYIAAQRQLAAQLMQQEHPSSSTVPASQPQARRPPPPLPPRENSSYNAGKDEAYSSHRPAKTSSTSSHLGERGRSETMSSRWQSRDPRSSSMQSLRPAESHHGRRTLLLIYIHGFMGNETSFQSFPAHLHSLLTTSMQESHVVHSKIYPRYKSRNAIEFARDGFSKWLEPHENENTDIVLLGHSMGGILSAEVCLKAAEGHSSSPPFKHRILGEICFDTPFLGMHPGLVGSGIASLFRPSPPPPGSVAPNASAGNSLSSLGLASPGTPGSMNSEGSSDRPSLAQSISSSSSIVGNDPYYNPPFPNDIHIKERTGWNKFLHFAKKHSDDFTTATTSYFMSHIEFGGCLADFPGLKKRYARIRELEDVDATTDEAINEDRRRIRFVNYYTASTGILKANKIQNVTVKGADGKMTPLTNSISQLSVDGHERGRSSEDSQVETPRISIEEHREGEVVPKRVRVNTMGETAEDKTDSPYFPKQTQASSEPAETAMKVVKEQISDMGANSGVHPADAQDNELAPMQVVDAMPIMSDEEYDHSEDEYNDAQAEKSTETPDERSASDRLASQAPERAPPPPPIPAITTENTLAAPEPTTPMIIRTPPTEPAFPPLPSVPDEPLPFNPADYEDKDARKIAEKDHKRLVKQYAAAVKDHESAVKDREKMRIKREKKAKEEAEKIRKQEEKDRHRQKKFEEKGRQVEEHMTQKSGEELRLEQEAVRMENEGRRMRGEPPLDLGVAPTPKQPKKLGKSRSPSPSVAPSTASLEQTESNVSQAPSTTTTAPGEEKPPKKKKDRRFCLLPNDLTRSKEIDKCWVRVYMEGVDEVGAHCGLFFQGQQYESLVGDVGERIAGWIREDATRRMVTEYRDVD